MNADWIRSRSIRCLAPLLWCLSLPAKAQEIPQLQEVLIRLDRLEKDNQALVEEVRALRRELAAAMPSVPGAVPPGSPPPEAVAQAGPSAQAPLDETRAVEQSRIEEMAATKVEASQKFPIRLTGMALFNAYVNGRFNNQSDEPTIASLGPGASAGGATLRQTTLGLLYDGPATFAGGKVSGSLYFDFFGGSSSSLNHMLRLRTADITLRWANTSVSLGQQKPLISPRDPD